MAWRHEGSRHERGYGYEWTKRRDNVMQRDGYLCQPCWRKGRPTPATQVDHIIPKSQDGTDDYENLEAICNSCHAPKSQREALEARGIKPRDRLQFDRQGRPVWQ